MIALEPGLAVAQMPGGKAFEQAYQQRFKHGIELHAPSPDGVGVLIAAIEKAGRPIDRFHTLEGYTPQTNLNRLNLGVSHKLTQDLALRASYNIRKDDDFTQQGINVGVSLDF
ncbi:hypothetical protein [Pseudomonas chlororaphis]|uniref:hypothetical protein n=1 Tax=Pseudomonas chlororaphis TaxID=587753 RepID=UPI0024080793|nr:hypothetical protein [Pseudomonas chlororaphis]